MRSTFKILFYLKKNAPKPDGTVPIMCRITVDGVISQFSCIFLGNMNRSDGKGTFSSYVFGYEDKNKAFFSKQNPDAFVKYGKYEMRICDKILIEAGYVTKAKVKLDFAYPYLWKAKPTDAEYKESWGDPIKPKIEKEKRQVEIVNMPKKNKGLKR